MNTVLKYAETLSYLRPGQLYHRLLFKTFRPKPDLRPAPEVNGRCVKKRAFAAAPDCLLGGCRFRFINEEHEIKDASGWNDAGINKLWLYNLHYFDFLRQPDITGEAGALWIERWIKENPPAAGNGWEPYTLSLRIVNWIKWRLAGHELSAEALHSLAVQTRYLGKRLEYHLMANHLLANAKALVFAGCFFDGAEASEWLEKGLAVYRDQLPEQILNDGGHFELSAMYHSIILEDLLDLKNISSPLDADLYITKMLRWLAVMTGPDGKICLFNDAAHGIAAAPDKLLEYAAALGFRTEGLSVSSSYDLPDTGYARLQRGDWTCICDGAPIGPDYQPGHSHADTLTFELWHKDKRIICDSGTKQYIQSDIRRQQRGTAGHNTAVIDGKDSSYVWSAHRVAGRARIIKRFFSREMFSAAHNGYSGIIHERDWIISEGGLIIGDYLQGAGTHGIALMFHFSPECKIFIIDDKTVKIDCGEVSLALKTDCDSMEISPAAGRYSPEFGVEQKSPVICFKTRTVLPFKITTSIYVI